MQTANGMQSDAQTLKGCNALHILDRCYFYYKSVYMTILVRIETIE